VGVGVIVAGKIWGSTECLLQTPFVEMHRISVRPKARCSKHHHAVKANAFHLLSGELEIHVRKPYGLVDVTHLRPGESCVVPPGEVHWFQTDDVGADALEIYYPTQVGATIMPDDIVREDSGKDLS
jgi:mannose-6-phosphate isomerase-like protein (cupin superfamily)